MDRLLDRKLVYSLSVPLILIVILASNVGLANPAMYDGFTPNWKMQTVGQDAIDLLLVVPVLLVATVFAAKGNKTALTMWAGTNIYLVYTFVIYCFDVRFNTLFIAYCFALGLSSYSIAIFLYRVAHMRVAATLDSSLLRKTTSWFMMVLAVAFYILWLADVLPSSLLGKPSEALVTTGLVTNPVHVIDLAIVLPLSFVTGLLMLKCHPFATLLAPVLIFFFVIMDITIGVLAIVLYREGLGSSYAVAIIMAVHASASVLLFILLMRRIVYTRIPSV